MDQSLSIDTLDFLAKSAGEVEPRFEVLPKYQKAKWSQLMLSTMFRRLTYKQLVVKATKLFGKLDYKSMWRASIQTGYCVKNLKAWLFWCVKKGLRGSVADLVSVSFEVEPEDRKLRLLMSKDLKLHLKRLAARYPALKLDVLDRRVITIYEGMRGWLGKFIHKKMRFVYEQQGLEAHDMQMEVFAKGIHGLYMTYPVIQTALHATNIVKSAAHNYGINMIVQQTHARRARLIRGADNTFGSRVISINELESIAEMRAPDTSEEQERVLDLDRAFNKFGFKSETPRVDLRVILHQVENARAPMKVLSTLSRPQRLMLLCMGVEDKEFSTWLTTNHRIRSQCSDYIERADRERFLSLAFEFLNIPASKGRRFIDRLQKELAAYSPLCQKQAKTNV